MVLAITYRLSLCRSLTNETLRVLAPSARSASYHFETNMLARAESGSRRIEVIQVYVSYKLEVEPRHESAQIMRVKFMTKPGAQWVIRRMVLNGIRDLVEREGISFAHHEVTVLMATDGAPLQLTDEQTHALGAAAQRVATRRKHDDAETTKDEL